MTQETNSSKYFMYISIFSSGYTWIVLTGFAFTLLKCCRVVSKKIKLLHTLAFLFSRRYILKNVCAFVWVQIFSKLHKIPFPILWWFSRRLAFFWWQLLLITAPIHIFFFRKFDNFFIWQILSVCIKGKILRPLSASKSALTTTINKR